MYCHGKELMSRLNEILSNHLKSTRLRDSRLRFSGEASPTIWSCYANFSVFTDRIGNKFLKK